jgi:hypothetical protein
MALIFLIFKLSFISLSSICWSVLSFNYLIVLKESFINLAFKNEDSLTICLIIHPVTFVDCSVSPTIFPIPILKSWFYLSFIFLSILIGYFATPWLSYLHLRIALGCFYFLGNFFPWAGKSDSISYQLWLGSNWYLWLL